MFYVTEQLFPFPGPSQSSVLSIHPEAFEPLRFERTVVEEGVDVTETTTKLRGFWFDFNSGLSSLPWDILFTVSKSLSIISNPDLSQLTILQNVTNAPVMRVLKTLIIFANKGLTTLPTSVLDKIPGLAAPATAADRTEIHFTGNGNQCDGCGLSPLVNWAKSRPQTTKVALRLTCQSNCADNITGVEQAVGHAYATLTSDFWRTYVEPACNADLTPVACRSVSDPVSASTPSSVSGGPVPSAKLSDQTT
ncbi:hypothetical protein BV898_12100 [Hypsibius exemplaris]|uniref:Uncharacterized protein n=1 Tax=Hypsibius exemplaris TaxID=2072580 RepID=A0A1W0WES4_HYPEX|nr:hypothetical protein BV898_12100 [Hypsibius exemplaris]